MKGSTPRDTVGEMEGEKMNDFLDDGPFQHTDQAFLRVFKTLLRMGSFSLSL